MADDCTQIFDPLRLVREGTNQDGRWSAALDPASAPADGRDVPDGIVFASRYAALLKFFDGNNNADGDWSAFFGSDVSVPLAIAAIEDVENYKQATASWFGFLDDLDNASKTQQLRDRLGYLYSAAGTLALALDGLKETLPEDVALKTVLRNLIRSQLAPALKRLISYYKAGEALTLVNAVAPSPPVLLLRTEMKTLASVLTDGLSGDWSGGGPWAAYAVGVAPDASVYGAGGTIFVRINHCATHNLFRSVFDQFLRVFARTVAEAKKSLEKTLTDWDGHAPHYALFLAVLRLLDFARQSGNRLTQRHLDFYYRTVLGLAEKPAEPGRAHLLAELGKQALSHRFEPVTLFKAGKDSTGKDAFYAASSETIVNQSKVASLQTVYRHGSEQVDGGNTHNGRIFASPVANSGDGKGGPLTSPELSWHPFFNKVYVDGKLAEIAMAEADVGFAIASHHFLMAEGPRFIWLGLSIGGYAGPTSGIDFKDDIRCFLTTEEGWLEKPTVQFAPTGPNSFLLVMELSGADPPVTPYVAKTHGYAFDTDVPVLLVKLSHATPAYAYAVLESITVSAAVILTTATALKSIAVSNDFGPVDTSKPFQPFGTIPIAGSSLTIGSKELFGKPLWLAAISIDWQIKPKAFAGVALPAFKCEYLSEGQWIPSGMANVPADSSNFFLYGELNKTVRDEPDFSGNEFYGTASRQGFVRLKLTGGFGQKEYQDALIAYLKESNPSGGPPEPPPVPTAAAISVGYISASVVTLNSAMEDAYTGRSARFFHLTPFGAAEQHSYLTGGGDVTLLPRFEFSRGGATLDSDAEFYIGISGLKPPQDLTLLFQVSDGTANPLAPKPRPHIDWSYLSNNRWIAFETTAVQDGTGELLDAGIVKLSVPREATNSNSLLASGLHWIRAAVHDRSDAVCRLQLVAAQALEAVFSDRQNAPDFGATPLPAGTIGKLVAPVAAVKSIAQPFSSFGGRGAEDPRAFYTRVSERLRHKDREIALWDYEHSVLEAFPQIHKVKCLNHTRYEPSESGSGTYNELAAGHVTLIAIPQIQAQTQRDPLKPYTSLGQLEDIASLVAKRASCFVRLHVRNPQFEEVRLALKARFYDGFDESFHTLQLQQAITRFLSPWAFNGGSPSFGGKVYKSVLVNFIEDQPYVDYVTDVQVFLDINGIEGSADLDEVQGSLAVSMLVSAPASKHKITIVNPAADAVAAESCGCES